MKHATGAAISVSARLRSGSLIILVENGPGIGAGTAVAGLDGGLGVRGLRDRVQDAGGTFSAGQAGQGWRIRAEFPLRDSADSRLVLLATDLGGKAPS